MPPRRRALREPSSTGALASLAILLAAIAGPGLASATHWSLYYAGVDPSVGETREDDGAVLRASGNPLDGTTNRVNLNATDSPGDGALFLDARVANAVGTGASTLAYRGDTLFQAILARDAVLLPGARHVSAWSGWWLDLSEDHAIADAHDGCAACGGDEFVWRGIGSGDAGVAVVAFQVPMHPSPQTRASWERGVEWTVLVSTASPSGFERALLLDSTDRTNPEQGWVGTLTGNYDGGLLMTVHTLVVADPPLDLSSPFGHDLSHPRALRDVDRHETVSADVESLYLGAVAAERGLAQLVGATIPGSVETPPVSSMLFQLAQNATALAQDPQRAALRATVPPDPREPNTPRDDSEGRATFGGIGDAAGSLNEYPGFATGFHLFFDAVARTPACAGAWAAAGATTIAVPAGPQYCHTPPFLDPVTDTDAVGASRGARTSGLALILEARIVLWHDMNGDGYPGAVCDPANAQAYDASRGVCRNPPHPWQGSSTRAAEGLETRHACPHTTLPGATFTITPQGGAWSNALLVRDLKDTTRIAFEPGSWTMLEGSGPAELRWRTECYAYSSNPHAPDPHLVARDAIVFLGPGARVPLEIETSATIPGFQDHAAGIEVGRESVLDVDILLPLL